uniref:Uncharacterized protein n=1 Tax=Rhizophora mucronata TaxID=61149 RepID=A0A2P2QIW5_RHIMU
MAACCRVYIHECLSSSYCSLI